MQAGVDAGMFRRDLDLFLTISSVVTMLATSLDWFKPGGDYAPEDSIFDARDLAKYKTDDIIDFYLETILRNVRTDTRIREPAPRKAGEQLLAELATPQA